MTEQHQKRILQFLREPSVPEPSDLDVEPVPVDAALEQRLFETAMKAYASKESPPQPVLVPEPNPVPNPEPVAVPDPVDDIAAQRARRRRWLTIATLAVAAAAALVVVIGRDRLWPRDEPLPEYSFLINPPPTTLGADPASSHGMVTLPHDGVLRIDLRPPTTERFPIEVHAWLRRGDGDQVQVSRWPVEIPCSPEGRCGLVARVDELPPLTPGPWEIGLVVGRRDRMPDDAEVARLLRDKSKTVTMRDWTLVRRQITIQPPSSGPLMPSLPVPAPPRAP